MASHPFSLFNKRMKHTLGFQDTNGYPSYDFMAYAREQGFQAVQEVRQSLRGGAAGPVLPMRRRIQQKTKPSAGLDALYKSVGAPATLATAGGTLAGLAGAPAAGAAPAGGILAGLAGVPAAGGAQAGGTPAADEVWVLASIRPGMTLGQTCAPTSNAVFLRNKCLDFDTPAEAPFLLEKIKIDKAPGYERDTAAEWRSYFGRLTPQEDAAAGGPRFSDGLKDLLSTFESDDPDAARFLRIETTAGGFRSRDVKEYANTYKEAVFDCWPLQGPRTVLWRLLFVLAQTGGGFTARVQAFTNLTKLSFNDGHMAEYGPIARDLTALTWDQLNIANVACMELFARRSQLLEEKYRHRLPRRDTKNTTDPESDAGLFLGLGTASSFGRVSVCAMPALSEYIGAELGKEAAISKGMVRAHQLREDMKKLNGGGGGKKQSGGSASDSAK